MTAVAAHDAYVERQIRRFRNALYLGLLFFVMSEIGCALHLCTGPHKLVWDYLTLGNPFLASGFLGAFVIFACTSPGAGAMAKTLALGVALESIVGWQRLHGGETFGHVFANVGGGLGLAAVIGAAWLFARAPAEEKRRRLQILLACGVTPTFLVLSNTFLELTVTFHPLTFDSYVYTGDNAFGVQPSFALAVWANRFPALVGIVSLVYVELPAAFAVIFALETRGRIKENDVLSAFLFAGFLGFACYHALPLVGPRYAFIDSWPNQVATTDVFQRALLRPVLVFRNCVPSLHTTWALLLFWYSRPLARRIRVYAFVWLVLTAFATLALGYHFLLDLVIATPFACFVQGLATSRVPVRTPERARALGYGAVATLGWFVLVRFGSESFLRSPTLVVGTAALTVVASFVIESDLARTKGTVTEPIVTPRPWLGPPLLAFGAALAAVLARGVFADGLAAALDTSRTTLGLVWLAGIAIGLLFQVAGDLRRIFVRLEIFAGASTLLLAAIGFSGHIAGAGAVASLFVLPFAVASGIALAPLARAHFVALAAGATTGLAVDLFLSPLVDAWIRVAVIVAIHGGLAWWAGKRSEPIEVRVPVAGRELRAPGVAVIAAVGSMLGLVTLVHLLGVTMPFASTEPAAWLAVAFFVVAGVLAARGARSQGAPAGWILGLALAALAFFFLASPFFVQELSPYFSTFGGHYPTRDYDARAFVRMSLGVALLFVPALASGAALGVVVAEPARWWRGTVAGWVAGGFLGAFAIGTVGSLRSLEVAALLVAAGAAWIFVVETHLRALVYLMPVILGGIAQPRIFDWTKLAGGGALTFDTATMGAVDAAREDLDGVATVHDQRDEGGALVRTIAWNGEPRGTTGEPGVGTHALRHARIHGTALVIGAGNGATAEELAEEGTKVEIVEPHPALGELARSTYGVTISKYGSPVTLLAHGRDRFDIVTLEAPNLRAVDGAAWLTADRLGLVAGHLNEDGVLVVGLGLDQLDRHDIGRVLGTLHATFAETWVYAMPSEAVLVGCRRACPPVGRRPVTLAALSPAGVDRLLTAIDHAVLTSGNAAGIENRAPLSPAPWPSDSAGDAFVFLASQADR